MANILICDDERSICEMLDIALRHDGHRIETVQSGQAAKNKIDGALYDLIITDIKMPNIDGIEVLRHAHRVSPDSAVILITAVDDYEAAVQAVKAGGASDYIRKSPGLVDEIKLAINRSLEKLVLSKQNFALRRDAAARNSLDNIIGTSAAMEKLKQTVRIVASTASTVLIHGESGTGKELVARAVHVCSPRATDPFVSVNCGAFPETLLESELFGYLKGAFTGANQNKRGLFEMAGGGTIFLDEIGEMTMAMQVKLLRVLQERTVRPVGGANEIPVDVRVIAASNRGKPVSRRPLLPPECHSHPRPRVAGAPRRHSPTRESFPQEICGGRGAQHSASAQRLAQYALRIRMARQRAPVGKYRGARRGAGNHRRIMRPVAGGAAQGARSRGGNGHVRNGCRVRIDSSRWPGHGKICGRHRTLVAAKRAQPVQRRADQSRRSAANLVPLVPPFDEEVRTLAVGLGQQ
jgi:CheY-like chemotaxis protein